MFYLEHDDSAKRKRSRQRQKEHRMKRGHVTGTKHERKGISDWYKQIEEANI
jgi:hypothetical protein